MILGAEIGMLIVGILALVKGKLVLSKNRVVLGAPARVVAIFALLPLPVAFLTGAVLGLVYTAAGQDIMAAGHPFQLQAAGFEFGIVVLCAVMVYVVGMALAERPSAPQK